MIAGTKTVTGAQTTQKEAGADPGGATGPWRPQTPDEKIEVDA